MDSIRKKFEQLSRQSNALNSGRLRAEVLSGLFNWIHEQLDLFFLSPSLLKATQKDVAICIDSSGPFLYMVVFSFAC